MAGTDADRLLANGDVEHAAQEAALVERHAHVLETPDQRHPAIDGEEVVVARGIGHSSPFRADDSAKETADDNPAAVVTYIKTR